MIVTVLAVLHMSVCVFLILLIMIQDPKGGSNSLFGAGGSNTLLGTSGGADFMTKLTRYVAIIFVGLCVALTIATRPSGSGVFSKSPLPESSTPAGDQTEAIPETVPAGTTGSTVPADSTSNTSKTSNAAPKAKEIKPMAAPASAPVPPATSAPVPANPAPTGKVPEPAAETK